MRKRNAALDLWKFVFTIVIVLYHARNLAKRFTPLASGYLAVEFFFIVSGALMAASAARKSGEAPAAAGGLGKETLLFIRHKIGGLLPNYYVGWVIAFLVTALSSQHSIRRIAVDLVKSVPELTFISELGFRFAFSNGACWYISAMLLAIMMLYPFLRRTGEGFYFCWAPLIAIFFMGVTFMQFDKLSTPHDILFGFMYKGVARAIMGIALGCVCYRVSVCLRSLQLTRLSLWLLTLLEVSCFAGALLKMWLVSPGKLDWFVVLLLAAGVTVTMSSRSLTSKVLSGHVFSWLGVFSYSLFLSHGYWSHAVPKLIPNGSIPVLLCSYLVISVLTALAVHFISLSLRKWWTNHRGAVKHLFIKAA